MLRLFTLLFLFVFSGCVSIPKGEIENEMPEPVSLARTHEEAKCSSLFEQGEWPKETWWEIFHDPQLAGFILTALGDSPTLMKTSAKVEVARQIAKEKRSFLYPNLDVNANSNFMYLSKHGFFRSFAPQIPASVTDIYATLNLEWDLDLFGRNKQLYAAASSLYHSQEAENAQARLSLSAAVAKAYFELQANRERLFLLNKLVKNRRAVFFLAEARKQQGLVNEINLLQEEKNLFEIENDLTSLKAATVINEHLVLVLMGKNPDQGDELKVVKFSYHEPLPLPNDLSSDLLARRPDLMAQIWKVQAAANEIGAAKASFYPNINLMAFAGFEAIHFNQLFSWSSRSASFNPALHLPIFTAGRLRANLRAKRAQFNEEIARYHELLLFAAKDVVDQLTTLLFLEEELKIEQETVRNVKNQNDLIFQRYSTGLSSYIETLKIEELLLEVQLEMVDLRLKEREACVNLIRALGGGYHFAPPLNPSKKEVVGG
jgi:NodT family efflux transporter outer membrane factor (OMF) lipoprotein